MKKITALAAAFALAMSLCACSGANSGAGNELLSAASPETSALMLYACDDGQNVRRLTMYRHSDTKREIFDGLAAVTAKPAESWTAKDVTMPVYGLEIGRNDDEPGWLEAAWSNGYLITADGSAYEFDFDFPALETAYEWSKRENGLPIGSLPCSRALALCGDEWISSMLTPAEELSPPEGISMTLDYVDRAGSDPVIAVTFANGGGEGWQYGAFYHLEVLLNGVWYGVPWARDVDFPAYAILLHAGEERQELYNISGCGELPAGTYRIVIEDLSAEFEVE